MKLFALFVLKMQQNFHYLLLQHYVPCFEVFMLFLILGFIDLVKGKLDEFTLRRCFVFNFEKSICIVYLFCLRNSYNMLRNFYFSVQETEIFIQPKKISKLCSKISVMVTMDWFEFKDNIFKQLCLKNVDSKVLERFF